MIARLLIGVRAARHAPLVIAEAPPDRFVSDLLLPGQPVLIERHGAVQGADGSDGATELAFIAVGAGQVLFAGDVGPEVRVVAAGYGSPAIIDRLGQRNAAALRTAQALAGPTIEIRDAAWHQDQGHLQIISDREPGDEREALRDRLAAAFKTEIRFAWPGGEEQPHLG